MQKERNVDVFSLLEELQAIARNGLYYAENPYDKERYHRLMALTLAAYEAGVKMPASDIHPRFIQEIGQITPKVGADAAIFNEQGEILLMERIDGSGWCLPCGWVEPNEKPATATVREVWEETGLEVVVERLVGVFSRPANAHNGPHSMVAIVHLCHIVGGELRLSHEGLALRYWPVDAAINWHATHQSYARAAHEIWQSEMWMPAISD